MALCIGVFLLCLLAAGLAYLSGNSACTLADVSIPCGKVRGRHCGQAYVFKGIPYARPPTGPLRWMPPREPTCWNNTLVATEFKPMCAQVQPLSEKGKVMGSEDCLYVNVWTSSLDQSAKLPVMVWIHGGYLHILSGSEPGYSPTMELTEHSAVVHVSFNYRLNAFGFMALNVLREGSPTNTSGNYGFMDQVAALRWVQKNIQYFGGDPDKVTIYGQSSGGTSVWAMMVSPLAKGLFHRAIDISGSSVFKATMADAEKDNLIFLDRTGCHDVHCLRQLSVAKILQSIPWNGYPDWAAEDLCDLPQKGKFVGPVAVVDGYVIPAPPLEVWQKKLAGYSDVPYMVGTTLQETEYAPTYANISQWSKEDYQWFVKTHLDTFGGSLTKDALSLYPLSDPCPESSRCVEKTFMTMVSDIRATCPKNELAKQAAAVLSSPVYRYVVTYTPSVPVKPSSLFPYNSWFAFHILDTLGFFGTLDFALGETTEEDRSFQRLMRKYFLYFAKEASSDDRGFLSVSWRGLIGRNRYLANEIAPAYRQKPQSLEEACYREGSRGRVMDCGYRAGCMPDHWPEYPKTTAILSTSLTTENDYRSAQCTLWQKNDMFKYAWVN